METPQNKIGVLTEEIMSTVKEHAQILEKEEYINHYNKIYEKVINTLQEAVHYGSKL